MKKKTIRLGVFGDHGEVTIQLTLSISVQKQLSAA